MILRLNLSSRTYLDRRSVQRWLLLTGGLLALLLAVNLLYGYRNVQQLRQVDLRLAEIDSKLLARRGQAASSFTPERFARLKSEIAAANEVLAADRFRWTELLGRLEDHLPDDVAVRSLKPNFRDRSLQLSAVARDAAAMKALLDTLLASEDMSQTFLLSQSLTEQEDGEPIVQFDLLIREAF